MNSLSDIVWIVDDDDSIRWVLDKAMQKASIETRTFADAESVLDALQQDVPSALITDIKMPGIDGLELLKKVQEKDESLPVIVITAHSDLDSTVSAYKGGAFEYLPKPFDIGEAVTLVKRAFAARHEQEATQSNGAIAPSSDFLGESPAMQEVFRIIGRLSASPINVLVTGESGTGKELVAKALHKHGPRASNPFIAINTAAIPRDLLESELFGHEKGAFTGAQSLRQGRFEQADGGTLFLDEIGDMPAELQTRLLRVLADGTFYRVGGRDPVRVDVRIVAATHQKLEDLVAQGKFREDLFHRLNVIRIQIPSLRERREDIPALIQHFLKKAAAETREEPKVIQPEVVDYLVGLDWPGNVRQLENTCRWLAVMAAGKEILLTDLPPDLQGPQGEGLAPDATGDWQSRLSHWAAEQLNAGADHLASNTVAQVEEILIRAALNHTQGYKKEAAILLGWGRNTLTRKIKELGLAEFE